MSLQGNSGKEPWRGPHKSQSCFPQVITATCFCFPTEGIFVLNRNTLSLVRIFSWIKIACRQHLARGWDSWHSTFYFRFLFSGLCSFLIHTCLSLVIWSVNVGLISFVYWWQQIDVIKLALMFSLPHLCYMLAKLMSRIGYLEIFFKLSLPK